MRRFSGFTLMELLIVIVIVGILASVALPSFGKTIERTRVKDAQATLASVYSAERVYRLDQGGYGTLNDLIANRYVTNPNAGNADWTFTISDVSGSTSNTFTATANRSTGGYSTNTVWVNQNFNGSCYNGNHPFRDFTSNPC